MATITGNNIVALDPIPYGSEPYDSFDESDFELRRQIQEMDRRRIVAEKQTDQAMKFAVILRQSLQASEQKREDLVKENNVLNDEIILLREVLKEAEQRTLQAESSLRQHEASERVISREEETKEEGPDSATLRKVKVIETVPALGESITEGSIALWRKNEGDKIAVDDVIVVVETDKVTVDIKATAAGILTKKIAIDKVDVGAPLYELETDSATASQVLSSTTPSTSVTSKESTQEDHSGSHAHKPSIKFLGKRSKQPVISQETKPPAVVSTPPQQSKGEPVKPAVVKVLKPSGKAVDFNQVKDGAMHGRPKLSEREMAAIESGGADF